MIVELEDNNLENFKAEVKKYALIRWQVSLEFKEQRAEQRFKYIDLESAVCNYFDVAYYEVLSKSRRTHLTRPRHFLCFLMWEDGYSYPAIRDKVYPDGDHTSAMSSVKKIKELIGRNKSYTSDYEALYAILNKKSRPS